jgi:AmmeMemoRadiSam system protein B
MIVEESAGRRRAAAVAGQFYAAGQDELIAEVDAYLAGTEVPPLGKVRAAIVPHAGFPCSGQVAAYAFKALQTLSGREQLIYLMGPAHRVPVTGMVLPTSRSFVTPLGEVTVDDAAVQDLVDSGGPFYFHDAAHRPEHCLEVELPFLQRVMPDMRIVPGLLGQALDHRLLATYLTPLLDAADRLLIVSSDLSHYHSYMRAVAMDKDLLRGIEDGDWNRVAGGEACGLELILALMNLSATFNWQAHTLAYCNSGDTCGSREEVVGYCAVVFTD